MGITFPSRNFSDIDSFPGIDEGEASFIPDFRELLCSVRTAQFGKSLKNLCRPRSGHMTKYLYSNIVTADKKTGAGLFQRVLVNGKDWYYIPGAEARIIENNSNYFRCLYASERPVVLDLGTGTDDAVMCKLIPTLKYVNARGCIPYDYNAIYASNAAAFVKRSMPPEIDVQYVHGDFTRSAPVTLDEPILMTMFGCTLSQFPFEGTIEKGETTFESALTSIGEMVNFRNLLIASIDTNNHPDEAKECYAGRFMGEFQRHFWATAKTIIENAGGSMIVDGRTDLNPADAVIYDPQFHNNSVHHISITRKKFVIQLPNDEHSIRLPPLSEINIGPSEKWSDINEIKKRSLKTGHEVVNVLRDGKSTVCFLVLAGRNVSDEQKARASAVPTITDFPEPHVVTTRPMRTITAPRTRGRIEFDHSPL